MRRLRFIIPKEGIDHFSICPCIRSKPMPRSVAKTGDIFPKLIMPLAGCDGPAFCFESKANLSTASNHARTSKEIFFCGSDGLYAKDIPGCNVDLHAPFNFLVELVKLLILTPKWPF